MDGEKRGAKKKKRVKKGGKKGRKRKEKDLTPDRTTESLFEELVLNGRSQLYIYNIQYCICMVDICKNGQNMLWDTVVCSN